MQLAMIGLGRMGANMTARLLRGGHQVVAYDVNNEACNAAEALGATTVGGLDELVGALTPPRVAWMMVPVGDPVETTVGILTSEFSEGDIVIDGGNSHYTDSIRRADLLAERSQYFIDVGTSGGVWGLAYGYSMMVGGDKATVEYLRPIFETLATAPDQGWGYVGPSGAGHYAKMVHNGVEYALMQAYAEGFNLLHHKQEYHFDLHQVAEIWRYGSVVRSWLLDLVARALESDPELTDASPAVPDTGEGRWMVIEAIEQGCPLPVISQALATRVQSRDEVHFSEKMLTALRHQFGGHALKSEK